MGSPPSVRFGGFARFNQGDPNQGDVASQFVGGGVNSDGGGSILMNVVWTNGSSGQYNARAYDVQRTRSGGLTAGLRGTTVDTSGSGRPARLGMRMGSPTEFGRCSARRVPLCASARPGRPGLVSYALEDRRRRPSPA